MRHAKNPVTTSIQPGEFVAVVGPSGVGKSTLIKAILGEPRAIRSGQVYVNDRIATEQSSSDRLALGYSSQSSILHTELSAVQVLGFMGDFRNSAGSIDDLLQQVDLPVERWQAPLRQLSGGECNRVRTAAELVHEPRLLLLDEPTSGLDARREEQMLRFLRNLSYRGCTILLVTHTAESHLQYFDKVIKFVTGGDVLVESQSHRVSDYRVLKDCIGPARQALSVWPQTKVCLRREWALLQSELFWRFLLPALIVPLLFGTAIGLAVPQSGKSVLLGYLAVLATIWSGTSLSLNSIVGERSVFQHERLLFLRLRSYLFGKVASLYLVGVVQVLVLLSSLGATRYCLAKFGDDASIYEWLPLLVNWHWSSIILLLVNSASIGCGLIISAFSWHSRPTANFLLPLFMMAQILFSVPIVVSDSASLVNTYGKFHVHSCQGAVDCEGAVESIEPPLFGGYLCKSCRSRAEKEMAERSLVWEGLDLEAKQLLSEAMSKAAEDDFPAPTGQVSLRIAKGLSYLTLSRWGDMALRGTATSKKEAENFRDYLAADLGFARAAVESEPERSRPDDRRFAAEHRNSRIWYLSGFGALILLSVVPPLLVLLVILVQERLVVHFGSRV
ncbi:MAG: ATP-binding cassette domain-containing protein [Pirellulaceae bacterium]|nr:ATP-binding cassette domain-containing protein [Pirellulaceae bacterium]